MPSSQARFLDRTTPPHVATLVAQSAIAALAMNVFLPSLPSMATYFQTDYAVVQLSVSLYLAVNAVLQVFIGALSDRYGRRPVMLAALWVFVIATLGTLAGAQCGRVPAVSHAASGRRHRHRSVAHRHPRRAGRRRCRLAHRLCHDGHGGGAHAGPGLGGLLDEAFGWRGSFGLMLVAGVAVLALSWRDMGETRAGGAGSFRAQFAEMPELMRSRRFWGYCATSSFASGAFFAYLGGAPFVGAQVFGLAPAMLGLFFGAPALGYAGGQFRLGRFAARVGIDRMILIGALINFGGMALLSLLYFGGLQTAFVFFGCFVFVGLGNGMILPSATSGMMSVRPHLAGSASGIGGAIMIGAGAALSALAGVLLTTGQRGGTADRDAVRHHRAGGGQHSVCHRRAPARLGLTRGDGFANATGRFAKGTPWRNKTVCRCEAARDSQPDRADAKGFRGAAGRVPALSEPDGKQQPPAFHHRGAGAGARIRAGRDRAVGGRQRKAGVGPARGAWPTRFSPMPRRPCPICGWWGRMPPALRAPFWTCTAPTGKRRNSLARWMRPWAARTARLRLSPVGRGARLSSIIATIT